MAAAAKNHRIAPVLLLLVVASAVLVAPAAACGHCPTPTPPPPPPTPVPCPPPPATPTPSPPYTPPSPSGGKCPINTLKLMACVDALNGLVHAVVGADAAEKCCPLLQGVADLDAALCLCTAIKAKALGLDLVVPIAIEVLVNECHKNVPANFQCPS